jgi:hypothetical protein
MILLGGKKSHVNSGFGAAIITDQIRTIAKLNKTESDEMEMERFQRRAKSNQKEMRRLYRVTKR